MTIKYTNLSSFYDGIQRLVMRGLHFNANGEKLTIEFTGGF
tara:strand:- start:1987 stop:2109 length:123 start_codon:yes stop_codon:yes gene_type:complete